MGNNDWRKRMKVKELIKQLKKFPRDSDVCLNDSYFLVRNVDGIDRYWNGDIGGKKIRKKETVVLIT